MDSARIFLLLAGIALSISGFFLRSSRSSLPAASLSDVSPESSLSGSLAVEPISIDSLLLSTHAPAKQADPPTRIVIPDLRLDVAVQPARIIRGYWEVFDDRAGFGLGSAYPQETGNQVIFAHAREGLFLPLKSVKMGQRIYVLTAEKWYTYEVKEIKDVLPSQKEVIAPTTDATLTLYTCTGFADSKRLIVVAKRITEESR